MSKYALSDMRVIGGDCDCLLTVREKAGWFRRMLGAKDLEFDVFVSFVPMNTTVRRVDDGEKFGTLSDLWQQATGYALTQQRIALHGKKQELREAAR